MEGIVESVLESNAAGYQPEPARSGGGGVGAQGWKSTLFHCGWVFISGFPMAFRLSMIAQTG